MVLVSRLGIYATHFWENIAFDPEEGEKNDGENDVDFFNRVLGFKLKDGVAGEIDPLAAERCPSLGRRTLA